MCGIYGVVGTNSTNEVMKGIKRLEYRGYDSAGIALLNPIIFKKINQEKYIKNLTFYDSGIVTIKEEGQIEGLEKIFNSCKMQSEITIGHTRWATHGKPSPENCHPHVSENGMWAVVHNGIIENYLQLKSMLKGMSFRSETDSEVVAGLLQHFYKGDAIECLKYVCSLIEGSYAFAIIFSKEPDKIYVAKRNSPVIIGVSENLGVVCSDINSITGVKKAYILENNNYAVVEKGKVTIYDENLKEINIKSIHIDEKIVENNRGEYKHFMLKEIDEIPFAIERTVLQYDNFEKISKAFPLSKAKEIDNILIVGCGTAYHAGLIGKKLLSQIGIKTKCEIASEFIYDEFLFSPSTLAIFVSQSGETADTLKALNICKEKGLKTLSITNVRNSSICFASDYLIYTNAGAEIGVASTKAYDCQVAVFYLLSVYLSQIKKGITKDDLVKNEVERILNFSNQINTRKIKPLCKKIAKDIFKSESIYMIGRGFDYIIAQEASLKLKEISYITSEAYPAGELKHGTISLIDNEKFVFAFATTEKTKEKMLSNVNEVVARGGKVILFTQFKVAKKGIYKLIKLPKFDEKYMPLYSMTYMQLISYYTSCLLGNNPDKPRSLAKSVTVE